MGNHSVLEDKLADMQTSLSWHPLLLQNTVEKSMNQSEYIFFFPQDICVTQISEIMGWKYLEGSVDDIMKVSV